MLRKIFVLCCLPVIAWSANPQIGFSELAANQAQPHITINAADRAITSALLGQLTINFASDANLTLSTSQWQYATIVLTDTGPVLTTGRDVVYPNVDTYTGGTSRATFLLKNSTARTLTVKRSGQTGVAVTAGSTSLLHHNGTDIEAVTSSGGSGAPDSATYITQTANGSLSAEQALGALATGILKSTTTTGVLSIAAAGTDYYAPGGTDVAFADGGTGLSAATDDQTLISSGSAWVAKTLPDCTDTGGNHINYTQSTNAFSCGTSGGGGGTPGGSTTQVQYNNAGAFAGDADWTWTAASNLMTIGSVATPTTITSATGAASGNGAALTLRAGTGGATDGSGGVLTMQGGTAQGAGDVGGGMIVRGGTGGASGIGGSVTLQQGTGSGGSADGEIILQSSAGAQWLAIDRFGEISVGNGSSGTAGQTIKAGGNDVPPTWGVLGVLGGGTTLSTVAQGDLIYASSTSAYTALAKNTTATRYLANTGASNNPAWAQVALATGVSGTLPQANRLRTVRTITAAGAVTGAATDEIICLNKTSGAATTVNLHSSPATGFEYTIKDCKGDALTNNITLTPAAGNIDGAGTYVINTTYGAVTIFYNGAEWSVENVKL